MATSAREMSAKLMGRSFKSLEIDLEGRAVVLGFSTTTTPSAMGSSSSSAEKCLRVTSERAGQKDARAASVDLLV